MKTTQKMLFLALAATLVAAWLAPDPEDADVVAPARQAPPTQGNVSSLSADNDRVRVSPRAQARVGGNSDAPSIDVLAVRLRAEDAESDDAAGLFVTPEWAVPAAPVAARTKPLLDQPLPEPAAPSAPPLPFTVMGSMQEAGQRTVFLQLSGDSLVVRAGDTLVDQYKVEKIEGSTMVLRYLPLNQLQTLEVGREP